MSTVRLWYSCLLELTRVSQELLLSGDASDHDHARDIIAGLITSHRGEFILRMGSRPPHESLFLGESVTVSSGQTGWHGIPRMDSELSQLCGEVNRTVEELGGKVCYSMTI